MTQAGFEATAGAGGRRAAGRGQTTSTCARGRRGRRRHRRCRAWARRRGPPAGASISSTRTDGGGPRELVFRTCAGPRADEAVETVARLDLRDPANRAGPSGCCARPPTARRAGAPARCASRERRARGLRRATTARRVRARGKLGLVVGVDGSETELTARPSAPRRDGRSLTRRGAAGNRSPRGVPRDVSHDPSHARRSEDSQAPRARMARSRVVGALNWGIVGSSSRTWRRSSAPGRSPTCLRDRRRRRPAMLPRLLEDLRSARTACAPGVSGRLAGPGVPPGRAGGRARLAGPWSIRRRSDPRGARAARAHVTTSTGRCSRW